MTSANALRHVDDRMLPRPAPATPHPESLAAEWSRTSGLDPEFFGNHVLNDTSIVLWIEALFDGQVRRRLLFPGDAENWCYLSARYGAMLTSDVLKAPHHGGRVFMEKRAEIALDGVYQLTRPKIVMVSGCGRHHLPRGDFRDAAARWGGSLICTSTRGWERIFGEQPEQESCFEQFSCHKGHEHVPLTMTARCCDADKPACVGSHVQGPVPLVVLKQHVIDPSPLLDRFTEGELDNHVGWLVQKLDDVHSARCRMGDGSGKDEPVAGESLAQEARRCGRYRLVAEMEGGLLRAKRDNRIWCEDVSRSRSRTLPASYRLPSNEDRPRLVRWRRGMDVVFLRIPCHEGATLLAPVEMLGQADTTPLAAPVSTRFRFPSAMFREAVWPWLSKELLTRWQGYIGGPGRSVWGKAACWMLACFKQRCSPARMLKNALAVDPRYACKVLRDETATRGKCILPLHDPNNTNGYGFDADMRLIITENDGSLSLQETVRKLWSP